MHMLTSISNSHSIGNSFYIFEPVRLITLIIAFENDSVRSIADIKIHPSNGGGYERSYESNGSNE